MKSLVIHTLGLLLLIAGSLMADLTRMPFTSGILAVIGTLILLFGDELAARIDL